MAARVCQFFLLWSNFDESQFPGIFLERLRWFWYYIYSKMYILKWLHQYFFSIQPCYFNSVQLLIFVLLYMGFHWIVFIQSLYFTISVHTVQTIISCSWYLWSCWFYIYWTWFFWKMYLQGRFLFDMFFSSVTW